MKNGYNHIYIQENKTRKGRNIMNDKTLVVLAICFLAGLATFRPDCPDLLELFKNFASGLYGLVTGYVVGKALNNNTSKRG